MNVTFHNRIRLVCLDFDGTCVDYEGESAFLNPDVLRFLNLAEQSGIRWCTNSGRTLEAQLEILAASCDRGLSAMPEALMCGESFLYLRENGGYVSHGPWNERAVETLAAFHREVRLRYTPDLHEIAMRYDAEKMLFDDSVTAYLIPSADQDLLNACLAELHAVVKDLPHAFATRNGGWVFVGHREFGKGRVLDAYLRERGYAPAEAVAVGDNLNDLDMLDGSICEHVGCPGNSLPEVIAVVQRAGGRVSQESGPAGTLEVLHHYLTNT